MADAHTCLFSAFQAIECLYCLWCCELWSTDTGPHGNSLKASEFPTGPATMVLFDVSQKGSNNTTLHGLKLFRVDGYVPDGLKSKSSSAHWVRILATQKRKSSHLVRTRATVRIRYTITTTPVIVPPPKQLDLSGSSNTPTSELLRAEPSHRCNAEQGVKFEVIVSRVVPRRLRRIPTSPKQEEEICNYEQL